MQNGWGLTDSECTWYETIKELAAAEFKPKAMEWDSTGEFAWENLHKMADEGLMGLTLPKEYGGKDRPLFELILALEAIARSCHVTSMILQLNVNGPPIFIRELGTDWQKETYIPKCVDGSWMFAVALTEPDAGSALSDLSTSAARVDGGWEISGRKHLITHGHVSHLNMVLARFMDPKDPNASGVGAALVRADNPGATIGGTQETMRGGNEAVLDYKKAFAPDEDILVDGSREGASLKPFMNIYNVQRLGNAAISIGLAQSALDEALAYANERKAFGRPIAEFQGLQWRLAEMVNKLEAARGLVYNAARIDREISPPLESAHAKLFANRVVNEICDEALSIFGGIGYIRGTPVEWLYRAARGQSIAGGSIEMQLNLIAEMTLGRRFSQRNGG